MTSTELPNDQQLFRSAYRDWIAQEGVPLADGFCLDLRTLETTEWPRFGVDGAIVNVAGRGDYLDLWLLDLAGAASTVPMHHIFEVVVYVISGHGNTVIETPRGTRTFEWGPRSGFTIPLNCRYQFHNASGSERARLALVTSFPLVYNIFYDLDFIFGTGHEFAGRLGDASDFDGVGHSLDHPDPRARGIWATNFVPDLGAFYNLAANEERGKASKTTTFDMADSSYHVHMSEIPVGSYKKAHRHFGGTHIFPVTGQGYSLLWFKGDAERMRVDWEHGCMYAPPDDMYHQHFNVSPEPARYFAIKFGSFRREFSERITRYRRAVMDAGLGDRAAAKAQEIQIEYEDEDPAIKELYLAELARAGIPYTGQ